MNNSIFNDQIKKPIFILGFILLMSFNPYVLLAQFNAGNIKGDKFYAEIPFSYEYDKIVIEAAMNGVKGRYLLDTGAMCILFCDSLQEELPIIREMNVGDATGKKQKAQVVEMRNISIGGIDYENIPTLYVDMFEGPFECLGYDGIIGSNLLRFGAFKIDWIEQKIIIADSYQTIGINKKGVKMRVNKQQSSPFIKVDVNDKNISWVLLDTGSGDSFSLSNVTAQQLIEKNVLSVPDYVSTGTSSHGAWGAGSYETAIFSSAKIQVGNSEFTKVTVETTDGKSKVGMKLLDKANFVFDYPQKRFFWDVDVYKKPISLKSFGIDVIMVDNQFVINGIWQGSQAHKEGIKKGDVIFDIEGTDMINKSPCEVFIGLKELTQSKETLLFHFQTNEQDSIKSIELKRIKF